MTQWMTPNPIVVHTNQTVAMCRTLVEQSRVRHLPVVEDGWLVGVLQAESLDSTEAETRVGDLETVPAPTVGVDAPFEQVLETLASTSCDVVVVTDEGRPVGVFTEHDAVVAATRMLSADEGVHRWMSPPLATIDASASATSARERFGAEIQRHLVVTLEGELYGMLSWRDVVDAAERCTVAECVRPLQVRVPVSARLVEVARLMVQHRIGSLPVMDGDRIVGVLSRTDMLAALTEAVAG